MAGAGLVTMWSRPPLAAAIVAIVTVAALTGCSGPGTLAETSPTSSISATGSRSQPAPAPSASVTVSPNHPAPTGMTTTVRATHVCTGADLSVSVVEVGAAAGSAEAILVFRNMGATACSMLGYPTVLAVDAAHHLAVRAVPSLDALLGGVATVRTVAVAPGQAVSSTLQWGDNPIGDATTCSAYPLVEVTPPDTHRTARLRMPEPVQGCRGVEVLPVVAGSKGTFPT